MRVAFVPRDLDASGCYRAIFPMAYLGPRGHECFLPAFHLQDGAGRLVAPFRSDGLLGKIPPGRWEVFFHEGSWPQDVDLTVFQGGSHRWQLDWALKARAAGSRVLVDVDDDFHRIPAYNAARLDPVSSPANNRRILVELLQLADAATFATEALRDFYGRWCDGPVVRNRLHWPMWMDLPPVYERREWRRFRVGYMGSMDYHRADLESIAPSLRKWLVANPDVEFVAAGDPRIHDVVGVPELQRVSTSNSWFRCLDLPYITSVMDVGLVPLVRNEFNECKSWLKGMEYAACGIPCLASPTHEYTLWVRDGDNGFLCRHPRDFVECLDALAGDFDQVRALGERAYRDARASSLDQHIGAWEAAYVADTNRPGPGAAASVSANTEIRAAA